MISVFYCHFGTSSYIVFIYKIGETTKLFISTDLAYSLNFMALLFQLLCQKTFEK